ncbi:MAG: hypothetical protein FWB98_08970 [Defluviitaleaceae bacterium]|nr:hypothetical protein [Defluviitaleaceae bacterium]
MMMISEPSLVCFLEDLRNTMADFRGEMPKGIHFINIESFYFYVNSAYPAKRQEIGGLMGVLEPFIPVTVSEYNLMSLLAAYASGDMQSLARLEQGLIDRSRLLFLQAAISSSNSHWQHVINTCCQVRMQRMGYF